MKETDARAFAQLFQDAYQKCFATPFRTPLTESESHHFSVAITEATGHEIGGKSLRNYSQYLLGRSQGKLENPSTPTLDALARYITGAPRTQDGGQRGKRDYGGWFRYKAALQQSPHRAPPLPLALAAAALGIALLVLLFTGFPGGNRTTDRGFTDDFNDVAGNALSGRGWSVLSIDTSHWAARGARPGHLTLFTLQGDNWPQIGAAPGIKNLLVRPVPSDCFVAELRLTGFVPQHNWQQAGLLLIEDTAFQGKSLRLSLGYNDFAGGFPGTREIIIQGVTSLGRDVTNPEEIVHQRLFVVDSATAPLIAQNLNATALRIEKLGRRVRLLYSVGAMRNAAFKEAARTEFDMRPAYIGVFALKGAASRAEAMPVYVDAFSVTTRQCPRG